MTASFLLHVNPRHAPAPGSDDDSNPVILPERRAAARTAITGFEGYRPTPLHRLTGLAETLGIAELWLKDESGRFGLGSFKALGGAYAVVHLLRERVGDDVSIADVAAGRAAACVNDMTVCCATDGNHGLAVAWGARRAGARCRVFLPGPVSEGRERAIAAQGAEIVRVSGSYDEAVRACAEEAHARGWLLVSDTSHGSFAAAFGATFLEEFAYADDGSFLSGTFADYLAPTAPEMPELIVLHPVQTPSPYTRLGAKGIAEGNQYSTPVCVANAVADALGIEDVRLPLTPARVHEWIHGAETPRAEGTDAPVLPTGTGRALTGGGEADVPAAPEEVWAILLDPQRLAHVIPGCRAVRSTAADRFEAGLDVGVGPVRGRFEAEMRLSELDPPRSATLSGSMIGPLGTSHGSGRMRLEPTRGGTRVSYDYEARLSGKVAAVGGRMLDGAARILIGQFFAGLAREAGGGPTAVGGRSIWRQLLRLFGIGR